MPSWVTVTSLNNSSTRARTARRSRPTLRRCRVWIAASTRTAAIPTTRLISTGSVALRSWPRHRELATPSDVAVAEEHEPQGRQQVEDHQRDERGPVTEERGEEHQRCDQAEGDR